MSPSIIVHRGPARMRERSTTRMPASAPLTACMDLRPTHGKRGVEVVGAALKIIFKLALVAQAELLEVGLAAFQEGVHALKALVRAPDMRQQFHAVLPRRVEQVGFEVEAFLGHAQRLRAVALDGL